MPNVQSALSERDAALPTFAMRTTVELLKLRGKGAMRSRELFRDRYSHRAYPPSPGVPRRIGERCHHETATYGGFEAVTLSPRDPKCSAHIIYTHGGAYVSPLGWPHWTIVAQLVFKIGAAVTVVHYPLAPEHSYRAAYEMLERVYERVLSHTSHTRVVLCGDSAGGGLALGQAHHFRDLGYPLPAGVVLFSPWLDLTLTNPEIEEVERLDALLASDGLREAASWWSAGDDLASPLLSPVYGDLSGLPAVLVLQGGHDLLAPDVRRLEQRMTRAGGTIDVFEYPGAFHVFVTATHTPESRDAFGRVERYVGRIT